MKKLNVVVDIETLSLRPDAAIISISAVPFVLDKKSLQDNDKYGYYGVPAFDEMTKDISCPEEYAPFRYGNSEVLVRNARCGKIRHP